ncbi:MAG: quinolinate synthase NadA [Bacteroidales bacterium]|jgi:quinolinate synthase|nr:quinolinate synthase NadA [Bacteroidales bacterium]
MKNKINNINELRQKKNAVILAHYYQIPEIQDIADFVGDSLALAQQAEKTNADIIVFAGVHFMAETAKILNPSKKVLIPDLNAGCSLADSCPAAAFQDFLKQYPEHMVLSYVNCTAAVKTLSDIIVTSTNALKIVQQLPENQKIVFGPDKNLGAYINAMTGRNMVLWDGSCHVHNQLKTETILKLKIQYPEIPLIAHPECQGVILEMADFIGSTQALLNYTIKDSRKKYLVATEGGIIHQMKKYSPDKEFIVVPSDKICNCNDCEYMKLNTIEKIEEVLENEINEITLSDEIIQKALKPLKRMLEMS